MRLQLCKPSDGIITPANVSFSGGSIVMLNHIDKVSISPQKMQCSSGVSLVMIYSLLARFGPSRGEMAYFCENRFGATGRRRRAGGHSPPRSLMRLAEFGRLSSYGILPSTSQIAYCLISCTKEAIPQVIYFLFDFYPKKPIIGR